MPAKRKKSSKNSKTTTIQVKKELKDELDLLKLLGGHEDLNALLEKLKEFYVNNNKDLEVDPKIEKLLRRMKK